MDFVTVIILYLKRSYPILGRDGKRYKLARVWSKQPFIFLSFKLSSSSVAGYFVVQIIWCALYVFLGKRREKLFDWWERINSPKFRLFVIKHELRGFPAIHLCYKRNWLCLIFPLNHFIFMHVKVSLHSNDTNNKCFSWWITWKYLHIKWWQNLK